MSVRYQLVDAAGLAPFVEQLRALERDIPYPIADGADWFCIDHGPSYHGFFTNLGSAHFLLAINGERVVGTIAGVRRTARLGERTLASAYLADFKVAKDQRGRGVARGMVMHAFPRAFTVPALRGWRLVYAAAMRGARGDVMRSVRGSNPGRLGRPLARLHVYFEAPESLRALAPGPATPAGVGLDLSPGTGAVVSTAGTKDFRLRSTGAPWPLVHLPAGPGAWQPSHADYLRANAATLAPDRLACFALDERLTAHVEHLAGHGVRPGATCTVYAWAWPPLFMRPRWVHLATSEI